MTARRISVAVGGAGLCVAGAWVCFEILAALPAHSARWVEALTAVGLIAQAIRVYPILSSVKNNSRLLVKPRALRAASQVLFLGAAVLLAAAMAGCCERPTTDARHNSIFARMPKSGNETIGAMPVSFPCHRRGAAHYRNKKAGRWTMAAIPVQSEPLDRWGCEAQNALALSRWAETNRRPEHGDKGKAIQ